MECFLGDRPTNSQGQAGRHGSKHKRTRNTEFGEVEHGNDAASRYKVAARRSGNSRDRQRRPQRRGHRPTRAIFRKNANGTGFRQWRGDSPFVAGLLGTIALFDQRKIKKRSCLPGGEIQELQQREWVRRTGVHGSFARILGSAISPKRSSSECC